MKLQYFDLWIKVSVINKEMFPDICRLQRALRTVLSENINIRLWEK